MPQRSANNHFQWGLPPHMPLNFNAFSWNSGTQGFALEGLQVLETLRDRLDPVNINSIITITAMVLMMTIMIMLIMIIMMMMMMMMMMIIHDSTRLNPFLSNPPQKYINKLEPTRANQSRKHLQIKSNNIK